jgi:protein-tyrosine phosphatase
MRYASLNLFLGAAISVQGFLFPSLFLPLLWLGLSFAALGIAYLLRKPSVLGKRRDGSIAWWSWLAFLPFHLFMHAVWHLTRLCTREHPTDRIAERLTVGRRLFASEVPPGIGLVVDLTSEFPEPSGVRQGRDYRWFPMLDASVPDIRELREFITALSDVETYVHCAQGHGRTGLFSIAYLVERGICATASEAVAVLTAARPGIALNHEQRTFITAHFG